MARNKLRIAIATYSNVQMYFPPGNVAVDMNLWPCVASQSWESSTCHGILKGMELAGRDLLKRQVAWWRLSMMARPGPAGVEGQALLLAPKTNISARS
ncbi:hypothetical protein SADUNF_Sadunf16G0077200 [Salix dunnii]|uniref:Uncharacterized protein n=1 Tax=Salix dunnii TaxID=1413687 RepID=A0A835JD01_9ROSI|nr:hypothetical protein SADUNF_Sadunf16G0077200 [Salix dunnii]